MSASGEDPQRDTVGLCAGCRNARVLKSAKGSRFWRCARADTDDRLLRYPPLPVSECPAFEPGGPHADGDATA